MPANYASKEISPGIVDYSSYEESATFGIVAVTGNIRPGGTINVQYQNAAAAITDITIGESALGVDSDNGSIASVAIPTDIPLRWGDNYTVYLDDGVSAQASSSGHTLLNRSGWTPVTVAGIPTEAGALADFIADSESAYEVAFNQHGYTIADGMQAQFQDQPNTTWNALTQPTIDPAADISTLFAVFDPAGGGSRTAEWVINVEQPDAVPDAFTFNDLTDQARSATVNSNGITVGGTNQPSSISIIGGEYSINGGNFTSNAGTVEPGQTVIVRVTTSANYSTATNATLTIQGVSDTFTATTLAAPADTTPDPFTLNDQTGVEPSTVYESNVVTITGITGASPVTISGNGEFSIDGGTYTNVAQNIANNETIQVRLISSASFATLASTTLTIGGVSESFDLTTRAADTTPNAFVFNDVTGATLSTLYTSDAITVNGILDPAPISVSVGAEYSIDGGAFTSASGTVTNGQQVQVRITSSASYSTPVNATLTVGGVSDTYTVTTESIQDTTPDAFSFTPVTNAAYSQLYTSGQAVVSGINAPSAISVSGGEYSINSGAFTSTPGTVTNGQQVRVRQTSSANPSTLTTVTLTIGGVTGDFDVTTSADNVDPVVTLLGANPMTVQLDSTFIDPGATATDNVDGTLTPVVTGTVDTSTVGSYILTYTATDAAGNSQAVQRTVNVVDVTAGATNEPIEAQIYAYPAVSDQKHRVLYRNNTNHIVAADIHYEYSLGAVAVTSATCTIEDAGGSVIYGPVSMSAQNGDYRVAVPKTLNVGVGDVVTVVIDIDSDTQSQGYWEIAHTIEERRE